MGTTDALFRTTIPLLYTQIAMLGVLNKDLFLEIMFYLEIWDAVAWLSVSKQVPKSIV